jgi:three-Cys-motif partner protein
MADDQLHRFGSVHTMLKLDTLGKYLPAYTTALKRARFTLHYIDAFAGTGVCHIKIHGERLMVPGSASIALACTPKFHRMVFIEKSLHRVRALERLRDAARDRDIVIIRDDANHALPACLGVLDPRRDRAIVFLDPYGMQVQWHTLEEISASRLADVWYLFPLSGLYRQATRDAAAIDEDKAASLTRLLGTEQWRDAFYRPSAQQDFFWTGIRSAECGNTGNGGLG